MAGNGSAFDRNDHQLIERLASEVGRVADELERLNDNMEDDVDEAEVRDALDKVLGTQEAGELVDEAGGVMAALGMLSVYGNTEKYRRVKQMAGLGE